jgi:hypothetical protein
MREAPSFNLHIWNKAFQRSRKSAIEHMFCREGRGGFRGNAQISTLHITVHISEVESQKGQNETDIKKAE